MIISIISAIAENMVIGRDNALPWDLPADLEYFKKQTLNKPVIMGQKTYESIGRALPNRKNIVLSYNKDYSATGIVVVSSIDEALKEAGVVGEVMIIGGASIYKQFLPLANRLYLTFIHHSFEGDSRFPNFDRIQWKEVSRIDNKPDERNKYSYSFVILEKNGV